MKLSLICLALLSFTGCSTTNLAEVVKAASGDPATLTLDVKSIYVTVRLVRIGATNISTTVSTDGVATKSMK